MNIYKDILFEKQKIAVDKSLEHNNFFLALAPGAGKTLTSLSIFQERGFKKLLVICQSSKLYDGEKEIQKTLGIKTVVLDGGITKDERNIKEFTEGAIIASYSTIGRRKLPLNKEGFMIIDESQYIKNHKSKIGEGIVGNYNRAGFKIDGASDKVSHTILLSGTPLNKPENLYAQMVALGMDMSGKDFSDRFLIIEEKTFHDISIPSATIGAYKFSGLFKGVPLSNIVGLTLSEAPSILNPARL